ncbi:hypothetical protein GE061_008788 [Apolygus lucorum]|uniref:Uncharacterized protein n=1 Tax=Apolygus lucorum TaxID=248454 RepID=A0A8S9WNS0_APOLU|nr:hypothetical protein GE061_008788 [Apolygus lucorum]
MGSVAAQIPKIRLRDKLEVEFRNSEEDCSSLEGWNRDFFTAGYSVVTSSTRKQQQERLLTTTQQHD